MGISPLKECFYLVVDGKKYGPWLLPEKEKFKAISHKKGVAFEYVRLRGGVD